MSNPSTFRAWLKRRRQERGFTQEQLGGMVGYAAQTITKIEGGQRRPSAQLALRLAEALQIAPEEQPAWMDAALAGAETTAVTSEETGSEGASPRPPPPSPGLPAYLTPLVGREREQADLAALLARPDCRLITLLGPGGVGKTRLAIETARLVPGFPDGVAFVALAPLATPTLIVPAIGDALGFAFAGSSDLFTQLVAYLHDRRVLLILDNLEHLLDPDDATGVLLERLLVQAPGIAVLATSRERLRLAGEWVLELQGLAIPQLQANKQVEAAPALRLFTEHAERVDRAFRLTPENVAAIVTICRQVDGLPLGIELAATWLRLLSLNEIAQELRRGLDSTQIAPRTLPARHHSLRAVVEHSWQLLNAVERMALSQLAVFGGGFTREAAQQVADATLLMLANLVDKSLLRRGEGGRYDLHEIIRQYADARLQERVEQWTATRNRHAAYFLRFVADREHRLRGADQMAALAELSAEIDNIRAAWGWAAAHDMLDELERAAEALQWFYDFRHWFGEGAALFAQAIEQLRTSVPVSAGDAQRTIGRLLGHYGYLAARSDAFREAHTALTESYALLADERDPVGLARTLVNQAMAAHWVGNYGEARHMLDRSLALGRANNDRSVQGASLTWASIVAHSVGEYEEAERLFKAALANFRAMSDRRAIIWCVTFCSVTLLALGKYGEAEQLLRESLMFSYDTGHRTGTALCLHKLGRVAFEQQNLAEAIYFFREALPLLRTSGSWAYAQAFNDLGTALWQSGAKDAAGRTYRDGLVAALQIQAVPEALQAMIGLAMHLSDTGNHAAALGLAARVLADSASRDEARRSATELQRAASVHLSADAAARIKEQASARPLAEFLTELAPPTMAR